MGEQFARALLDLLLANGEQAQVIPRPVPLNVGGVGHGSQQCVDDALFPIALRRADGSLDGGTFKTPIIKDSPVPGLLGNDTLTRERAILDCGNKMIYFAAPGPVQIILPPGSRQYPLESAPSGHMQLQISDYASLKRSRNQQQTQSQAPANLLSETRAAEPQL